MAARILLLLAVAIVFLTGAIWWLMLGINVTRAMIHAAARKLRGDPGLTRPHVVTLRSAR